MDFNWQPRIDGEDYVLSDDVNTLADGVIEGIEKAENAQNSSNNAIQRAEEAYELAQEAKEESSGGGVQSDWNNNDETSSSYIKGRTHYTYQSGGNLLDNKRVETTLSESNWTYSEGLNSFQASYFPSEYYAEEHIMGVSTSIRVNGQQSLTNPLVEYTNFKVSFDGNEYYVVGNIVDDMNGTPHALLHFKDTNKNKDVFIDNYQSIFGKGCVDVFIFGESVIPSELISLKIIPSSVPFEETVIQLDAKYIPDYISKTEVNEMVGDIDAALDAIIALQEAYIGGGNA